jgi:hypothetical protein
MQKSDIVWKIFALRGESKLSRLPWIRPSTGGGQRDSSRVATAWFAQFMFSAHESIRSLHNNFRMLLYCPTKLKQLTPAPPSS